MVVTADVARAAMLHTGPPGICFLHAYPNTMNIDKNLKYLLTGIVKVIPDPPERKCALKPVPYIIDEALKYTQTKFFRLMLDLMRLAQFEPLNNLKAFGSERFTHAPAPDKYLDDGIDYSVSVAEIDAQLYRKYGFTQPMIDFVERRYSYDNGAEFFNG